MVAGWDLPVLEARLIAMEKRKIDAEHERLTAVVTRYCERITEINARHDPAGGPES